MNIAHAPWLRRLIIAAWILSISVITYLSLEPWIETPMPFFEADKVWHFIAYGWLATLPQLGFVTKRWAVLGALLMLPMGVGLEFAQSYIPGRYASGFDMIANSIGVALGIPFGWWVRRKLLTAPAA